MTNLKYYSVRAHSGRFNGEALFLTTNKKKAKELAKQHWLDYGVIDSVWSLKQAIKEMWGIEDKEAIKGMIEDDYKYYMDMLTKDGEWVEIEWGT